MDREDFGAAVAIASGIIVAIGIIICIVLALSSMSTEHCTSIYTHAACTIGLNS